MADPCRGSVKNPSGGSSWRTPLRWLRDQAVRTPGGPAFDFDALAREVARGLSRREALRRLGLGLGSAVLASLGAGPAWANNGGAGGGGNSECAQWCHAHFSGSDAGYCTSEAAQGTGPCYLCGPAAATPHPDLCAAAGGSPVCCPTTAPTCCNGACTDLTQDASNCGQCMKACGSATPYCVNSQCVRCRTSADCPAPPPGAQCVAGSVCQAGTCVLAPAANGTPCDDGNACTQTDTCQNGVCVGSNPVVCTAQDQCHGVGTCDPKTGLCSNPALANGTPCDDGNACTQTDTCQNGVCTGGNPVVCTAQDQCHVAGVCDPKTGVCTNPAAADGTACAGTNKCFQSYACSSGACVGSNPVVCTAQDQCHVAGTCDPTTGICSNPAAANGTACNDGNACTQTDTCQNGVCVGGNPVVCTAQDQCHGVGTCDPKTGLCSNPALANGTPCDDGNACTQTDTCQNGVCVGSNPVVCTAQDQCHVAGTCDPKTGVCSNPAAANGTACNDGNACTQTDTCQNGVCVGGNPVVCTAQDQCHVAGVCNPTTGACSNPAVLDGTPCTTTVANATGTCTGGVCGFKCNMGFTQCGMQCVDTTSDASHCGSCTTACASPTPFCVNSHCVQCRADTDCPSGSSCLSGVCCPQGTMNCGGACINTSSDPSNCGGCNLPCGSSTPFCVSSHCVQCRINSDCGFGGICCNGVCCGFLQSCCSGTCADTNTLQHCGSCGNACPQGSTICCGSSCCTAGQDCYGGKCCLPDGSPCSGDLCFQCCSGQAEVPFGSNTGTCTCLPTGGKCLNGSVCCSGVCIPASGTCQ